MGRNTLKQLKSNLLSWMHDSRQEMLAKTSNGPGLNVNCSITFSCLKMFSTSNRFGAVWDYYSLKLQAATRTPHQKVTKLKSKFSLILEFFLFKHICHCLLQKHLGLSKGLTIIIIIIIIITITMWVVSFLIKFIITITIIIIIIIMLYLYSAISL